LRGEGHSRFEVVVIAVYKTKGNREIVEKMDINVLRFRNGCVKNKKARIFIVLKRKWERFYMLNE
jgi:hypothetical protein